MSFVRYFLKVNPIHPIHLIQLIHLKILRLEYFCSKESPEYVASYSVAQPTIAHFSRKHTARERFSYPTCFFFSVLNLLQYYSIDQLKTLKSSILFKPFQSLHIHKNGRNYTSSASGRPFNQHPPVCRQDRPEGFRHFINGVPPPGIAGQSSERGVSIPEFGYLLFYCAQN